MQGLLCSVNQNCCAMILSLGQLLPGFCFLFCFFCSLRKSYLLRCHITLLMNLQRTTGDLTKVASVQEMMQGVIIRRWKGQTLSKTLANDVAKCPNNAGSGKVLTPADRGRGKKKPHNRTSHLLPPFNSLQFEINFALLPHTPELPAEHIQLKPDYLELQLSHTCTFRFLHGGLWVMMKWWCIWSNNRFQYLSHQTLISIHILVHLTPLISVAVKFDDECCDTILINLIKTASWSVREVHDKLWGECEVY